MTWNRKTLLAVLTISLAFNAGFGTTFAVRTYQDRHEGKHRRSGFRAFYKALNLTEEQRSEMKATRKRLFSDLRELRREATLAQKRLADLVTASEPDREAIAAQIERVAMSQKRIQERLVEHMLHQKTLLPSEHQAQYNALIRKRLLRDVHPHDRRHDARGKTGRGNRHTVTPTVDSSAR